MSDCTEASQEDASPHVASSEEAREEGSDLGSVAEDEEIHPEYVSAAMTSIDSKETDQEEMLSSNAGGEAEAKQHNLTDNKESFREVASDPVSGKTNNSETNLKEVSSSSDAVGGGSNSTRTIIRALIKSERVFMTVGVAALFVTSTTNLAFPRILGAVVDAVATSKRGSARKPNLGKLLAGALTSFCIGSLASFTRVYSFAMSKAGIARTLRRALFSEIICTSETNAENGTSSIAGPYESHESAVESQAASLVKTLGQDVDVLSGAICKTLASTLRSCSSIIGGTAMLLSLSPRLTFVSIGILPIVGCTAMLAGKKVKKLSQQSRDEYNKVSTFSLSRMSLIKTVRLYGQEDAEQSRYEALLNSTKSADHRVAFAEGVFMAGINIAMNLSLVTILAAGGKLVNKGQLTGGQLTSFGMYSGMVALGSSGLSSVYADAMKVSGACHRLVAILSKSNVLDSELSLKIRSTCSSSHTNVTEGELPSTRSKLLVHKNISKEISHTVELQNIVFRYPNRDQDVIKNFSLNMEAGKVYALTGQSGAGKSTLVDLLTRFRVPTSGTIRFNGIDIQTLSITHVRKQVAVVLQQPGLFEDSIRNNIAYGQNDASFESVIEAARAADAHSFIEKLPDKYETIVATSTLSVGQKQRLAIARALLINAPIVVLDEGTASLSGSSESVINETIAKLKSQGKLVIVIAHRRTTLDATDLVCVLDEGSAVELGPPSQLAQIVDSRYNRITQTHS